MIKPEYLARALKNAISEGLEVDKAITNFMAVLKKRGMLNILPKVVLQLEHIEYRESTRQITLSVPDNEYFVIALKEVGLNESEVTKRIDKTLIGGYKLEQKGELKDASYKKQLLDLFKNITR